MRFDRLFSLILTASLLVDPASAGGFSQGCLSPGTISFTHPSPAPLTQSLLQEQALSASLEMATNASQYSAFVIRQKLGERWRGQRETPAENTVTSDPFALPLTNIVPTVTPLKRLRQTILVDVTATRRYFKFLQSLGITAILAVGATGEFHLVDKALRQEALRVLTQEARERFLTFSNISGAEDPEIAIDRQTFEDRIRETLENAKIAEENGADALVLAPLWALTEGEDEVEQLIDRVRENSSLPLTLYNNPGIHRGANAKNSLSAELVDRLYKAGKIVAIKDSSGNMDVLQAYRATGIPVFQGDEANLINALAAGAHGAVGSSGNVWAPLSDLVGLPLALQEALQQELLRFRDALTGGVKKIPAGLKHVLSQIELDGKPLMAPLLSPRSPELDGAEMAHLDAVIDEITPAVDWTPRGQARQRMVDHLRTHPGGRVRVNELTKLARMVDSIFTKNFGGRGRRDYLRTLVEDLNARRHAAATPITLTTRTWPVMTAADPDSKPGPEFELIKKDQGTHIWRSTNAKGQTVYRVSDRHASASLDMVEDEGFTVSSFRVGDEKIFHPRGNYYGFLSLGREAMAPILGAGEPLGLTEDGKWNGQKYFKFDGGYSQHGPVRNRPWQVNEVKSGFSHPYANLVGNFTSQGDPLLESLYGAFDLEKTYGVKRGENGSVEARFHVRGRNRGPKTLRGAPGWHPWLRAQKGDKIRLSASKVWKRDQGILIPLADPPQDVSSYAKGLYDLRHERVLGEEMEFDGMYRDFDDAFVIEPQEGKPIFTLQKQNGQTVDVFASGNHKAFVLYISRKEGAIEAVCAEPMIAPPDSVRLHQELLDKGEMQAAPLAAPLELQPGDSFDHEIMIRVSPPRAVPTAVAADRAALPDSGSWATLRLAMTLALVLGGVILLLSTSNRLNISLLGWIFGLALSLQASPAAFSSLQFLAAA